MDTLVRLLSSDLNSEKFKHFSEGTTCLILPIYSCINEHEIAI